MPKNTKKKKRRNYPPSEVQGYKKSSDYNNEHLNRKILHITLLLSIVILSTMIYLILFIKPPLRLTTFATLERLTTFATLEKVVAYNQSVSLALNTTSNYTWELEKQGNLKGVSISGSVSRVGYAKVYLKSNNINYLIFDSKKLYEDGKVSLTDITGQVVKDKKEKEDEEEESDKEKEKNEDEEEESDKEKEKEKKNDDINQTSEKLISLSLNYSSETNFDLDNNGIETLEGAVDFKHTASFNWDVKYDKLCTIWETYSIENQTATFVCYGSEQCCNSIPLIPIRDLWNESFISYYGLYGAGYNNIISAKVLFVDYNISTENSYAEIYSSNWTNLTEKFTEKSSELVFNEICIETCNLEGLNQSSYALIIEVVNSTVKIDKITYSLLEEIINEKPIQIKNLTDVNITKNYNLTINLSDYFYDSDGQKLFYKSYSGENITVNIHEDSVIITPQRDFIGTRYIYFIANDSLSISISNIFAVTITDIEQAKEKEISQGIAIIGKPVKWNGVIKFPDVTSNATIKIPQNAFNISIKKIEDGIKSEIPYENVTIINDTFKSLDKIESNLTLVNSIYEGSEPSTVIEPIINITLIIEVPVKEVELEYETPPPISIESELSKVKKQVVISSAIPYVNITAFTTITETPKSAIKVGWLASESDYREYFSTDKNLGSIVWVDITNDERFNVVFIDNDNDNRIDSLQWNVPHTSNQTYEIILSILNVQSFPTLGGNWTVEFTTIGTANLTISATNGTTYSEGFIDLNTTKNDLEILELRCDNEILFSKYSSINKENTFLILPNNTYTKLISIINKSDIINSIHVVDYNCSGIGYETVRVLTEGKHTQEFRFGNETAYAHNLATIQEPFTGIILNNTGAHINVKDELLRNKIVNVYSNDTLFAKYYNLSSDISTLYYDWFVNEQRVLSLMNRSNLSSVYFSKGDSIWVSIILNNGSANISSINSTDRIILDTTKGDFENGTLQGLNLSLQIGNITLNYNGSGTNFTLKGNFSSQIFDTGIGNTTYLIWSEGASYGEESSVIDGTVLLLHLNNNDTSDFSGLGNHATQSGDVNCSGGNAQDNGRFFSACEFDGINSSLNIINSTTLKPKLLTISTWIKGRTYSNENYTIIGMSNPALSSRVVYSLRSINSKPVFTAIINNSQINLSGEILTSDRWYFIVGVYNGSVASLYVNGLEKNSSNVLSEINYSLQGDVYVGRKNLVSGENFNGTIDEIRILNISLQSQDIMADYLRGVNRLYFQTRTGGYYDESNPRKILFMHFQKDALDYSGRGNDGVLLNNTLFSDGFLGAGVVFNGYSNFINISNSGVLRPDLITLSAFVNPAYENGVYYIMGMANGSSNAIDVYSLKIENGKLRFLIGNNVNISGGRLTNNTFHHVVGSYNGKYAKIFVDGVVVNSTYAPGIISYAYAGDIFIGKKNDEANPEYFNGTIDEVSIYDYGMREDEVRLLYQNYLDWSEFGRDYVKDYELNKVLGFDFSEMVGNLTIDESSYKNNGSISGADWSYRGKHGSGLSFDGVDDYVIVNSAGSLDILSNFSVSAWIKGKFIAEQIILEKSSEYRMFINHSRLAGGFGVYGSNETQGTTILSNETWHYVVATYDRKELRVYVDGGLDGKSSLNASIPVNNADIYIGGNSSARFFNGSIDSIVVYNRTLSAIEIRKQFLDRYDNATGEIIGDSNRYIQYRAFFETDDRNATPVLQDVIIRESGYKVIVSNFLAGKTNLTLPLNNTQNSSSILSFGFLEGQDIDFNYFNGSNYTKVYWSFEPEMKNSTHVIDSTIYNNSGLIVRAVCGNVTGKSGYGCRFSGNGSYIEVNLR